GARDDRGGRRSDDRLQLPALVRGRGIAAIPFITATGQHMERFEGTDTYIATQDLQVAVNASIALERPLLIKGEPGTGKTILAHEVAGALGLDLITWH